MKKDRNYYQQILKNELNKINYIPQASEQIIQCKPPYPDYWFISNMGYLFTVSSGKIEIIQPTHELCEKHKMQWCYSYYNGTKPVTVRMQRLVAEHFWGLAHGDRSKEVHHIQRSLSFTADQPQYCNRVTNLQLLDKSTHRDLTNYAHRDEQKYRDKIRQQAMQDGATHIQMSQNHLINFVNNILENAGDDVTFKIKSDDGHMSQLLKKSNEQ